MVEMEQALAIDEDRLRSDDDISNSRQLTKLLHRRKLIRRYCCYITALFIVLAIVIITLIFTVFRVKSPGIKLNKLIITKLELGNGTIPKPGGGGGGANNNMSLIADISVKNPNAASFTYSNTTTSLYYHGVLVGEAMGPPGRSRARRTVRMNLTVDLNTDRLMSNPNLRADLGSGLLVMDSYTRVGGRANVWNIFKRHVAVKMNCTTTFNISSQQIYDQKCKRKVEL